MSVEAIVLAGGLGTRLRSVVQDVPKPMAPVNGRPFLERLLEYWIGQGVRRFVLSVGYLSEAITRHFGSRWGGAAVEYSIESEPLGTGGGFVKALDAIRSDAFLVMNGDTYFAVPLDEFLRFHESNRADWSMALFGSSDTKRYQGVSLGEDGRIASLSGNTVNGGVYLMRRGLAWKAPERCSLENDLLPQALAGGWRLFGRVFDRPFVDIGVPQDYQGAGAIIQ
jgi:D-glycero-alpha-D-manno-heptose 1-phosphate guanylyltransferase